MPAPRYQMAAAYNPADGSIYMNGGFETSTIDSVQATTWKSIPSRTRLPGPSPQMQAGMATGIVNGHLLIAEVERTPTRRWSRRGTTTSRPIRGLRSRT